MFNFLKPKPEPIHFNDSLNLRDVIDSLKESNYDNEEIAEMLERFFNYKINQCEIIQCYMIKNIDGVITVSRI